MLNLAGSVCRVFFSKSKQLKPTLMLKNSNKNGHVLVIKAETFAHLLKFMQLNALYTNLESLRSRPVKTVKYMLLHFWKLLISLIVALVQRGGQEWFHLGWNISSIVTRWLLPDLKELKDLSIHERHEV